MQDSPMYAPVTKPVGVITDGEYEVGTVEQAQGQDAKPAPAPDMKKLKEEFDRTRRALVLDLAAVMCAAEPGRIGPQPKFDKSDTSHQRYIRMAEAVFAWSINR